MPASQPRSLSSIHDLILVLNPSSVIDVGVGHGKTGVLVREYLDIMKERYERSAWQARIYGIEGHAEYRNPLWTYAYDEVRVGDALEEIGKLPAVDLVVALDIWEHFEPEYAARMLDACLERGVYLLIATPMRPRPQGDVFGNAYERHVSQWSPRDFLQVPYRLATCTGKDWIMLLSRKTPIHPRVYLGQTPMARIRRGVKEALALWANAYGLKWMP